MKTLNSWIILLLFSMFSISCSEQDDVPTLEETPSEEEVVKDEYYVQYEVGGISQIVKSLSVATPWGKTNGIPPGSSTRSWSETYGPVYKGFRAYISASGSGPLFIVSIRVSKNGGPFALKVSSEGSGGASASYTIE